MVTLSKEYKKRQKFLNRCRKEIKNILSKNFSYEKKVNAVGRLWGKRIKKQSAKDELNPWRILPMPLIDKMFKQRGGDLYQSSDIFDAILKYVKHGRRKNKCQPNQ